jgi:putative ABC transport system permease protein
MNARVTSGFAADLRYALRGLRSQPGFTAVAALTLALAIGANTAVFTVVNGVLLRPLPFADADRLMVVSYWPTYTKGWLGAPAMLGRDYVSFQRANRSFDRVALIIPHGAQLTGAGEATTLPGALVSADFFSVLGIKPAIGRTFAPDEGTSTDAGVIVISNKLWREHFASDSTILGRTIVLDGQPQAAGSGACPGNRPVSSVRVLAGHCCGSCRHEFPRPGYRTASSRRHAATGPCRVADYGQDVVRPVHAAPAMVPPA